MEHYITVDITTGHCKLHSENGLDWLSLYITLSHHAGILFFSPESYPGDKNSAEINYLVQIFLFLQAYDKFLRN